MKVIFTIYNDVIDKKVSIYQSMVVEKFKGDIEFISVYHEYSDEKISHGDILNIWVNKLFLDTKYDCILILDIDCIPLSSDSINTTFNLAYEGNLVGNIQRSNHIKNNKHVYVAPSFMCLSKDIYKKLGRPSFSTTSDGDAGEQLTYNAEMLGIPTIMYMPKHTELFPTDKKWDLADGMPSYGIGTTFGYLGMDMSYHLFESRYRIYNKMFFNKCHQIVCH